MVVHVVWNREPAPQGSKGHVIGEGVPAELQAQSRSHRQVHQSGRRGERADDRDRQERALHDGSRTIGRSEIRDIRRRRAELGAGAEALRGSIGLWTCASEFQAAGLTRAQSILRGAVAERPPRLTEAQRLGLANTMPACTTRRVATRAATQGSARNRTGSPTGTLTQDWTPSPVAGAQVARARLANLLHLR